MEQYHHAWLTANKHRSKQWLQERLEDGFDIHHIDGNHENNDPLNLLLLECADHSRLHGLPFTRISAAEIRKRKVAERRKKLLDAGIVDGCYTSKIIKGTKYWYFQDNATRKQRYIGKDSWYLRSVVIEGYKEAKKECQSAG